ncbi:uncharacterized protein [Coffea arabica]
MSAGVDMTPYQAATPSLLGLNFGLFLMCPNIRSSGGYLKYGTLPREAVCTENLTPWLKLLPCRDKAGLSTLMDRPSIYRGYYHSQRLHLTSNEFDSNGLISGIVLDQTLTIVLQPNIKGTGAIFSSGSTLQPSWSLSSLFGRKVGERCVLSKSSNVYVQLEQNSVSQLIKLGNDDKGSHHEVDISQNFVGDRGFAISIPPDRQIREVDRFDTGSLSILHQFSVENYSDLKPFDLEFRWKLPLVWSCRQAPLSVSRYLMGSGNERGSIAISLKSTRTSECMQNADSSASECWLRVDIFQVVPWYVKVYYHTLKVFIDERFQTVANAVERMHVVPSEDKVSPGVMELTLKLPCGVRSAALTVEFDKGFLHIDEYPPDANQGFDIPSAVVVFGDFETSIQFADDDYLHNIPLLSKLQEKSRVVSYTEVLLVPLTTPDFSMPYNVITITCTVFALYFGSLLNALRRRVGEEGRLLKTKATKETGKLSSLLARLSAKLRGKPWEPPEQSSSSASFFNRKLILKVLLVAGLAVAWQYYSG